MLEEIGLEGGGPHSPNRLKPVGPIMEGDLCCEPAVEKAHNCLPEDLDESNKPDPPPNFRN